MNPRALLAYKDAGDLNALIEALWVFLHENDRRSKLPGTIQDLANNVLSYRNKVDDLIPEEVNLLWQSVTYLIDKLSGIDKESILESRHIQKGTPHSLSGDYWVIPKVKGFIKCDDHLTYARENQELFCNGLGIDPWSFMHALHSGENKLMPMVLGAGAVRANFSTNEKGRRVGFFQTSQKSVPWIKSKIKRMPLRKAIIRVVDPLKPYNGWESGITFILKK